LLAILITIPIVLAGPGACGDSYISDCQFLGQTSCQGPNVNSHYTDIGGDYYACIYWGDPECVAGPNCITQSSGCTFDVDYYLDEYYDITLGNPTYDWCENGYYTYKSGTYYGLYTTNYNFPSFFYCGISEPCLIEEEEPEIPEIGTGALLTIIAIAVIAGFLLLKRK
jgi:hypothetical protein